MKEQICELPAARSKLVFGWVRNSGTGKVLPVSASAGGGCCWGHEGDKTISARGGKAVAVALGGSVGSLGVLPAASMQAEVYVDLQKCFGTCLETLDQPGPIPA